MKYYPDNLVTVEFVLQTLENYKSEPSEVQTEVKQESIQKLGQLAASLGQDLQLIADRYQVLINRQQLTSTISSITGAVAGAVPIPIVQGLGVLISLGGSLLTGVQSKNAAKAQAEIQAVQLKIQQVQTAIQQIQESAGGISTTALFFAGIAAFFFIGR